MENGHKDESTTNQEIIELKKSSVVYSNSDSSFETISLIDGEEKPPVEITAVVEGSNSIGQAKVTDNTLIDTEVIHRKVRALKKLQQEIYRLEEQFYKEVYAIEQKYYDLQQVKYDERAEIVRVRERHEGVPAFWLQAMMNSPLISEFIESHDREVLYSLNDIKTEYFDNGFALYFLFSPNRYFYNEVLTLEFELRYAPDKRSFGGPIISACRGCAIAWKPHHDVTKQHLKRVLRHRQTGKRRLVTKWTYRPSFFHMFSPPSRSEFSKVWDTDELKLLLAYADLGYYIKDRLITRAVLYFTGEIVEEPHEQTCLNKTNPRLLPNSSTKFERNQI